MNKLLKNIDWILTRKDKSSIRKTKAIWLKEEKPARDIMRRIKKKLKKRIEKEWKYKDRKRITNSNNNQITMKTFEHSMLIFLHNEKINIK